MFIPNSVLVLSMELGERALVSQRWEVVCWERPGRVGLRRPVGDSFPAHVPHAPASPAFSSWSHESMPHVRYKQIVAIH